MERLLASIPSYRDSIPGLWPLHGADDAAEDADAPHAALLRLMAEAPHPLVPPVNDGWQLLSQIYRQRLLPTGCDAMDDLVNVGLREGMVYEVRGCVHICHQP